MLDIFSAMSSPHSSGQILTNLLSAASAVGFVERMAKASVLLIIGLIVEQGCSTFDPGQVSKHDPLHGVRLSSL